MRFISPLGILSSDGATGNLVWVDQVNGNDSLAARGRMTIPFRGLAAAKMAARSGDTIIVLPGTYVLATSSSPNLLVDGVNWHFLPGARVTYAGTANGAFFDTSSNGTNAAVSSSITGYGEFVSSATTGTAHIVHSAAAASSLFIQVRSMSSTNATVKITASSGRCVVEVLEDIIGGSADVIHLNGTSSENYVRARLLRTSGGAALYVNAGSIDVTAYKLSASADSAVRIAGGSGQITVRAYEIYAENNAAIYYNANTHPGLTILGARIVSDGVDDDGRPIYVQSASTEKIKLVSCSLIGSGNASIGYPGGTPSTIDVYAIGGAVGTNSLSNVTVQGSGFVEETNLN